MWGAQNAKREGYTIRMLAIKRDSPAVIFVNVSTLGQSSQWGVGSYNTSGIEKATARYIPQNSRQIEGRAKRPNAPKLNEQTGFRRP